MLVRLVFILIPFFSVAATAGQQPVDREFSRLAATPYPAQHGNPRNSDAVPYTSPTELKLKWKALEDSTIVQGCTTDRGQLYCVRGWDKTTDKSNLITLSEVDGSVLWENRINGECLLDEYALLTNPTIDRDGNLYINDGEKIVSFTAAGQLRWVNNVPASRSDSCFINSALHVWQVCSAGSTEQILRSSNFFSLIFKGSGLRDNTVAQRPAKE